MRRLKPPLSIALTDESADRARRNHEDRITELQGLPCTGLTVIPGITLPDGVAITIAHKLGRKPAWIGVSPPYNGLASSPGFIVEDRVGTDRTKVISLLASSWGATIVVDLVIL